MLRRRHGNAEHDRPRLVRRVLPLAALGKPLALDPEARAEHALNVLPKQRDRRRVRLVLVVVDLLEGKVGVRRAARVALLQVQLDTLLPCLLLVRLLCELLAVVGSAGAECFDERLRILCRVRDLVRLDVRLADVRPRPAADARRRMVEGVDIVPLVPQRRPT
eukprot:3075767-Prymnesium_polylepis.2